MTPDELNIETYRYRAPRVIPLDGDRYAVLCYGWDPEVHLATSSELHTILTNYTEWNVLERTRVRSPMGPSERSVRVPRERSRTNHLAALGITPEEFETALAEIQGANQ